MRKIVLATRNEKKKIELEELLADLDVEVLSLADFPNIGEIEETGTTFRENAYIKARIAAESAGMIAVADDSGLVVDALGGAPGVRSARFAGEDADDEANNLKLLKLLEELPREKRTARFVCVIAICTPEGNARFVEGVCEGRIAEELRGNKGFGYDPLFIPEGYDRTFAELGYEVKNRISHRARALQKAKPVIAELLKGA